MKNLKNSQFILTEYTYIKKIIQTDKFTPSVGLMLYGQQWSIGVLD